METALLRDQSPVPQPESPTSLLLSSILSADEGEEEADLSPSRRSVTSPWALDDCDLMEVDRSLLRGGGSSSSSQLLARPKSARRMPPGLAELTDQDIPLPEHPLPPEVKVTLQNLSAYFQLGQKVDLKQINLNARNSSWNPAYRQVLVLRLVNPMIAAHITPDGTVQIRRVTKMDLDGVKHSCRRITRIVQKCGYPNAKCAKFRIMDLTANAELCFPVRLDGLARKWANKALYEPDVTCGLYFRLAKPRSTFRVTASGKVQITGINSLQDAEEALTLIYPIFREFSR